MIDLTIIIPIHKWDETIKGYLDKAIDSVALSTVKPKTLTFVLPTAITSEFNDYFNKTKEELNVFEIEATLLNNDGETDFSSQVNLGVNDVKTKYFSILEFDDTYTKKWFENVEKHIIKDENISLFLPISNVLNKQGEFFTFKNEVYWAKGFASELGFIDEESLLTFFDLQLPGGVFKTEDFVAVGLLKPSIKVSFWYEFLLRLTNQGKTVYVIPKIGYNHLSGREGSLMEIYSQTVDKKEAEFWNQIAQKEYHFLVDRKKEYQTEKK
jgi:hypothetical protein